MVDMRDRLSRRHRTRLMSFKRDEKDLSRGCATQRERTPGVN